MNERKQSKINSTVKRERKRTKVEGGKERMMGWGETCEFISTAGVADFAGVVKLSSNPIKEISLTALDSAIGSQGGPMRLAFCCIATVFPDFCTESADAC